jgi:O-antigen/teichoic acid export membrane protein
MDFGITNYNTRTIAQDPDKLPELFPSMLSARLVLIFVYMSLAFLWAWVFGYRGWELLLLGGILLMQALNSIVLFIRSNVAALQRFKTDGMLSITDRSLMIIICGFMLLYPPLAHNFKIEWFVITQVVCYSIAAAAGYLVLRRIGGIRLSFTFHGPTILKIIKQSFPYALLIFQMSIYNRSDAIIMERLLQDGKAQADIWAAAFRLIDQANILGLMFATVLLPLFGKMLSEKQDVSQIVKLCVNMLIPFSFMVAIAGIFFSGDIMHLLYKGSIGNIEYDIVFAWLIASFPAWCLMYIYSTLLTANGSLKILNIIAFAGVIVNLSLNFYLVPGQKAVGGAMTSFITQTGLSCAFIIFASRTIKLPFNIKWVLAHIGYILLIVMLAYGVITILHSTPWGIQFFTFGAICIAFMFVFRFISISGVKQLMSKRVSGS